MDKIPLFAAGLLVCSLAEAQTQPPPAQTTPPVEAGAATEAVAPIKPRWLLYTGSFERPRVKARTTKEGGGSPVVTVGRREWARFDHKQGDKGGQLLAGLTNEIARTGQQSLYVEFNKLTALLSTAELASEMISILPGQPYRISIWGRVDKQRPLTLDQRIPSLRLEVEFFQADQETQTGESEFRTQPIPGSPGSRPLFNSENWAEFATEITAPEDAAFLRMTWTVASSPQTGETNGVIFFDDANVKGPPGKTPEEIADEEESAAAKAEAAEAKTEPTPATPPASAGKDGKKNP